MSETFDLGPTQLRVIAATDDATVLEGVLEPGAGSSWHTHTREDETLLVAEGTLVVNDGSRRELHANEAHVIPRGRRHAFANESAAPAHVYFFCAPGGLERFFRDLVQGVAAEEAAARAGLRFG